jgi:uncharacterized membrane protein YvbJ
VICRSCGAKIDGKAIICYRCGAPTEDRSATGTRTGSKRISTARIVIVILFALAVFVYLVVRSMAVE